MREKRSEGLLLPATANAEEARVVAGEPAAIVKCVLNTNAHTQGASGKVEEETR